MLTPAQKTALKTDIALVQAAAPPPGLNDLQLADYYNATAAPAYWVWRSDVARADIYNEPSASGSFWDWNVYKAQTVAEQNAWVQMFMGDRANFGRLNVRSGVQKIFTGSAPANAQRDHCFAAARRHATRAEKLFGMAVLTPPANTGNDAAQPRGSAANPDMLGFEAVLTVQDVIDALTS